MGLLIFIAVVVIVAAIVIKARELSGSGESVTEKPKYHYRPKSNFMTGSEKRFYKTLRSVTSAQYELFAQVNLPNIVDHTVRGQDWRAALAHINRKSVDFVLCDKDDISPKLAIELDDYTHDRSDRLERDGHVERILREAQIPLLRIRNGADISADELKKKIEEALKSEKTT